jgi:hypothetical protein
MILVFGVLTVFACVTINIYFPAEKVESVAGEIVDEIRGEGPEGDTPQGDKNSLLLGRMLAMGAGPVWADEVTDVSNATIRGLKDKLKRNYASMKPFYKQGLLAEQNNGHVSIKSTQGLGLKEQRDLKGLVEKENKLRRTLYEEVAKALNIEPGQVGKVAEIFAKKWQASMP